MRRIVIYMLAFVVRGYRKLKNFSYITQFKNDLEWEVLRPHNRQLLDKIIKPREVTLYTGGKEYKVVLDADANLKRRLKEKEQYSITTVPFVNDTEYLSKIYAPVLNIDVLDPIVQSNVIDYEKEQNLTPREL